MQTSSVLKVSILVLVSVIGLTILIRQVLIRNNAVSVTNSTDSSNNSNRQMNSRDSTDQKKVGNAVMSHKTQAPGGLPVDSFSINESPILDPLSKQAFIAGGVIVTEPQLKNYTVAISRKSGEKLGGMGYLFHLTVDGVSESEHPGLGIMNVMCSGNVKVRMLFKGDVCTSHTGTTSQMGVAHGSNATTGGKVDGDAVFLVEGNGQISMEFIVTKGIPNANGVILLLHKGMTFPVTDNPAM